MPSGENYSLISADSGSYADDCLVQRVTVHKCYIVATVSQDEALILLKR